MKLLASQFIGTEHARVEGVPKVTGSARYAAEYAVDDLHHAWPVQATIARGTVLSVDATEALAQPDVVAVLDHTNAPRLEPDAGDPSVMIDPNPALNVLQRADVAYRGQIVAVVIATTPEAAREAGSYVRVSYDGRDHQASLTAEGHNVLVPDAVNGGIPNVSERGDTHAALDEAAVRLDLTYSTPGQHTTPMEPHATTAVWDAAGDVSVYDATQSPVSTARILAHLFGLTPERVHVIAEHVGGGFGSKGFPYPPCVLAVLAARAIGKPVKVALTRQQMFSLVSHRTGTVQRLQIGARPDGRITALDHDSLQSCSRLLVYGEQTAAATRSMYAIPNLSTRHRIVELDIPTPGWMRAPGETPGMFALESALDELACATGVDPVELRLRNEPEVDPETGAAFTSRGLVECLRNGAQRFDWARRERRREGRWLIGSGMACGCVPSVALPSTASVRAEPDGRFLVRTAATDIGTGARTTLTLIAADALRTTPDQITLEIGRSDLPVAPFAAGSLGTASWGWAIVRAGEALLSTLAERGGVPPADGLEVTVDTTDEVMAQWTGDQRRRETFGAHFAEVRVDADTGEVRMNRMVSVFDAGRIVNPRGARSQFLGAMIMGVSMALHESLELDARYGDFANHDLASYHVAAHADIHGLEAHWIEMEDTGLNPMGAKGAGEIGIVGTAAAIANAVHHATGVRVRDLPITLERVRASPGSA